MKLLVKDKITAAGLKNIVPKHCLKRQKQQKLTLKIIKS